MELKLVGTGSILTSALSACSVIDDRILIDVPNGAVKAMRRQNVDPGALDACFVTHFHADHYFDVVFLLLELGLRRVRESEFLLAGPRGLEERVNILFDLAYPESWQKVRENSRVRFHEWPDVGGSVTAGHYSVRAVQVQHTIAPALGYIVGDGTATAGFSGDSELCAGIDNIMLESSVAVLDASFIEQRSGHMGAMDLMKIAHRFPQVRVIATHMSDEVREHTWPGVDLPSDGDCYHI